MTKRPGSGRGSAPFRHRYRQQVPDQDRNRSQINGRVYQGAVESVFAIPVAMGLGWFADRQFDSAPTGLLVGAGIGFAAFVLRLVRLGKEMQAAAATQETPPAAPASPPPDTGSDDADDDADDWGEDHRTH